MIRKENTSICTNAFLIHQKHSIIILVSATDDVGLADIYNYLPLLLGFMQFIPYFFSFHGTCECNFIVATARHGFV